MSLELKLSLMAGGVCRIFSRQLQTKLYRILNIQISINLFFRVPAVTPWGFEVGILKWYNFERYHVKCSFWSEPKVIKVASYFRKQLFL